MTIEENDSHDCYVKIKCFTFLSGRQEIHRGHLLAAGTFSLTLVPIVGVTNVLLLSHLRKKQNIPKIFHRLLQILCVADLLVAALALPSYAITLFLHPVSCNCDLELTAQFMAAMFGGTSGRTTVVIAFHQSMNVKSLAVRSFMYTKRYKFVILSLGSFVSLTVAIAVTMASKYRVYRLVAGAFTILDIAFLVAVIFLYLSAYHSVRKHVVTSELRCSRKQKYDKLLAKKVTRIITVLVICYGPFIVTNFVESFFVAVHPVIWLKLVNIWSYNIVFANSFLNALVFLCNDGVFHKLAGQYDQNVMALKVTPLRSVVRGSPSPENNAMKRLDINELSLNMRSNSNSNLTCP